MRRILAVVTLVLALPALAVTPSLVTAESSTQVLAGVVPTLDTEGSSIAQASGYSVTVSVESGQTITSGTLQCYYYGAVSTMTSTAAPTFRWMRCAQFDCTPAASVRDAPCGDYQTPVGFGRIYYKNNLVASGGTTAVVTITVRRVP